MEFVWRMMLLIVTMDSGVSPLEAFRRPLRLQFRVPTRYQSPGNPCDPRDLRWFPVPGEPQKFAYCHLISRKISIDSCGTVNGVQKLFDDEYQQCVMPTGGLYKAPGLPRSSRFGGSCTFNTDCLNNMYCPSGICLCLAGFIDVDSDCYPVVNPGQSGCVTNRQCEAVWPGSTCEDGVCQCPKPKKAVETRDGFVCVSTGQCPLPEDSEASMSPAQLSDVVDTTTPQCAPNAAASSDNVTCYDSASGQSLSDLYDCIPGKTDGSGICCANRALTCILPKKTLSVRGSTMVTRYWYNSATGSCEQFMWDPSYEESNANNFRTQDQCRSYCQTTCRRAAPEYIRTKFAKPKSCSVNSECSRFGSELMYKCSSVGASQLCCPSPDWICSPSGGRDYTPNEVPDAGPVSSSRNGLVRWYYDNVSLTCRSFTYKGEGGNFNNFHTAEECNAFCARSLCERGDPLKDSSGANQRCTGSGGCPSTYECRHNVCCPKKQTVCVQPKMVGTCTSAITRYWYNSATRDCEQFVYTGCNGNDNNFESYLACQNYCRDVRQPKCIQGEAEKDENGEYLTCSFSGSKFSSCRMNYECYFDGFTYGCCPTKTWTCRLNYQTGAPCVVPTVRWYFDVTSKSCQTFAYSGCDGNSNNFQTRQQCEQYCGVAGCPFGGEPYLDSNTMQRKVCNWHSSLCPDGYQCTSVVVNGNPINYCCPTRAYICVQSANQGTQCGTTSQRYYFNSATKVCASFTYLGCGGNENNFATLSQCTHFCCSAVCSPGESVYLDVNTQKPLTCNLGSQSGCPPSYKCRLDTLTDKSLCCGSSDLGVCPTGERAYIEALSQTPRECEPDVKWTCPENYLCRVNRPKNRYFCCASDRTFDGAVVCSGGKKVVENGIPRLCTDQPCPNGSACISGPSGDSYCCWHSLMEMERRAPTTGGCPPGTFPLISAGDVKACDLNNPGSCPPRYSCQFNKQKSMYQCCGTDVDDRPSLVLLNSTSKEDDDGCPPGLAAAVDVATQRHATCSTTNPDQCPIGYLCVFSSRLHRNQCCGLNAGCPDRSVAYIDSSTGQPLECSDDNACPSQFACKSVAGGKAICCSSGSLRDSSVAAASSRHQDLCPGGKHVRIGASPKLCSSANGCEDGYECLPSNGGAVCCPNRKSVCNLPVRRGSSDCPENARPMQRYFYSVKSGLCQQFTYNGCDGNENNFINVVECDYYCVKGMCPRGEPARSGSSFQFCDSNRPCPFGYKCTKPVYGPTDRRICCPSRDSICSAPPDSGTYCTPEGDHVVPKFYYNDQSGGCHQFSYRGCGGNGNNFATKEQCVAFCAQSPLSPLGSAETLTCLLPGRRPYVPNGATSPLRCRLGQRGACPRGYTCQFSGVRSIFICCSNTLSVPTSLNAYISRALCPSNAFVYIHPKSKMPKSCTSHSKCPRGFHCSYFRLRDHGFCCKYTNASARGHVQLAADCPAGFIPHEPEGPGALVFCALNKGADAAFESSCPIDSVCSYSSKLQRYICCGRAAEPDRKSKASQALISDESSPNTGSDNVCNGVHPFIYPGTSIPLACPGGGLCPQGYACQMSSANHQYVCCTNALSNSQSTGNGASSDIDRPDQDPMTASLNIIDKERSSTRDFSKIDVDVEELFGTPMLESPLSIACDVSKRKNLGEECCADEQCAYGCKTHRRRRICLCQSHMILDMTRKPFRCATFCRAWRDGGTCIRLFGYR